MINPTKDLMMENALIPNEFLVAIEAGNTVVDLRSAAAFTSGAFPGAISMPGHDAIAEEIAARWSGQWIVVYDERGEWTEHYSQIPQLRYLDGGLAAWKQWMDAQFADGTRIVILGGKTGAEKTEWLQRLRDAGERVLDLEALAQHKGSAFGNLEGLHQTSNLGFHLDILRHWRAVPSEKCLWVEEEGPFLGQVAIPESLYVKMLAAPMVELDVPFPQRLRHIVEEYGDAPAKTFEAAIQKLAPRMGFAENQGILHQYRAGKKRDAIKRLLVYYDRAYEHRRDHYRKGTCMTITLPDQDENEAVNQLIAAAQVALKKENPETEAQGSHTKKGLENALFSESHVD